MLPRETPELFVHSLVYKNLLPLTKQKQGAHFVARSKRYVHNPQNRWLQRGGVRAFLPIYSRFSPLFFYPFLLSKS